MVVGEQGDAVAPTLLARWGGFTLIELMVTLAVLAILATLAAPSFNNLINSNRLIGAANDLVAALQVARMEAIRRGESVVICPSTDGSVCNGTEWSRFIVFSDSNGNSQVNAPADVVLRDVTLPASGVSVQASPSVENGHRIRFSPSGFARMGTGADQQGALRVCSTKLPVESNARDVHVAISRISVSSRSGAADCVESPSD